MRPIPEAWWTIGLVLEVGGPPGWSHRIQHMEGGTALLRNYVSLVGSTIVGKTFVVSPTFPSDDEPSIWERLDELEIWNLVNPAAMRPHL